MEDQQPSSFIVESSNHQNLDVPNDSAKPSRLLQSYWETWMNNIVQIEREHSVCCHAYLSN